MEHLAYYIDDWDGFLITDAEKEERETIRLHTRTGRPVGGESFIKRIKKLLRRPVRPGKPGRPKKDGKQ